MSQNRADLALHSHSNQGDFQPSSHEPTDLRTVKGILFCTVSSTDSSEQRMRGLTYPCIPEPGGTGLEEKGLLIYTGDISLLV